MSEENCSDETSATDKLRNQFDQWLEAAWTQGERALDKFGLRGQGTIRLAVDVIENTEEVLVVADVPGLQPSDLHVSLTGNMLTIEGSKTNSPVAEGSTKHVSERVSGKLNRSIPLPVPVESEQVAAEIRDGVLYVKLAKAEVARPKHIFVNSGDAQQAETNS